MTDEPIETKTNNSEVGYKNPPVKSRFRKGQSGNPRGRRKGQRNWQTALGTETRSDSGHNCDYRTLRLRVTVCLPWVPNDNVR